MAPFVKKTFAPEDVARARALYEGGTASLDEVAASLGVARRTLGRRIGEWGWTRRAAPAPDRTSPRAKRGAAKPSRSARSAKIARSPKSARPPHQPRPPRRPGRSIAPKKGAGSRPPAKMAAPLAPHARPARHSPTPSAEALALRVQRVVERELDAIDRVLNAIGAADSADAERSARTLASLARALKEVMRLAAPDEPERPDGPDGRDRPKDDSFAPRDLDEFRRDIARHLDRLVAEAKAECPDEDASD